MGTDISRLPVVALYLRFAIRLILVQWEKGSSIVGKRIHLSLSLSPLTRVLLPKYLIDNTQKSESRDIGHRHVHPTVKNAIERDPLRKWGPFYQRW